MERKTDGGIFALIGGGVFTLCGVIIAAQCIKYGEFNSNIGLELFSLFGLAAALFLKKHEAVLGMAIIDIDSSNHVFSHPLFHTYNRIHSVLRVFGAARFYFIAQR